MQEKQPYVIVRKLPHGLWSQEDLRPTMESARARMSAMRAAESDSCAWDVWEWDQWEQMRKQSLTMDSFEAHSVAASQPPAREIASGELARALELLPDDRTLHAVNAAIGDLREVSGWYGALPEAFLASFVTSQLLGCVHLLGHYDEAAFLHVAKAAWSRYHTAASNVRRQQEAKAHEG